MLLHGLKSPSRARLGNASFELDPDALHHFADTLALGLERAFELARPTARRLDTNHRKLRRYRAPSIAVVSCVFCMTAAGVPTRA
jgi:hypothetical protein